MIPVLDRLSRPANVVDLTPVWSNKAGMNTVFAAARGICIIGKIIC